MAQVIIICPKAEGILNARPPLALLYLAAVLMEHGFTVSAIDETVQKDARDLLVANITAETICVGISTLTGSQLSGALEVAQFIRQVRPDLPIVWGGCHPTMEPLSTLKHHLVDAVCIGEGEDSFVEMVKSYQQGGTLHHIRGIGFKENNKPVLTEPRTTFYDLDKLPSLPYQLFDLNLYKQLPFPSFFGFKSEKILSLETSRGCPFHCGYCIQAVKKEPFRIMSPATVLRFMEEIVAAGAGAVSIVDDNFFINPPKAKEIMAAVAQRNWNLEFFTAVRSDYLAKIDDETYDLIKRFGIRLFGIGSESGSNRVLRDIIGKKENIEASFEANRRLAKHGIYAYFHFIVGFPGETLDDIIETYRAMTRITKENAFAKISNKKLIPLPNTPIFWECISQGLTEPQTVEDWANIQDLQWERTTPYIDQQVQDWFWNTRYYNDLIQLIGMLRNPYTPPKMKMAKNFLMPVFHCLSWIMEIRSRFKICGPFMDNMIITPLAQLAQKILSIWRQRKLVASPCKNLDQENCGRQP